MPRRQTKLQMKNKLLSALLSVFLIVIVVIGAGSALAQDGNKTGEAESVFNGIIEYKLEKTGFSSVQSLINGSFTKDPQSNAWYVLSLAQSGKYDFSKYQTALEQSLSKNTVASATSRQKFALTLISIGSSDGYISSTLEDSIGKQGIMSYVFGLHLLNNKYTSTKFTATQVKKKLLSLQLSDGGFAVTGNYGDADVTAMTLQALAPYYSTDSPVKTAINKALSFLSSKQLDGGDFASYGSPNPESTAQVIMALSALKIDAKTDSRFIKNGKTLFDGINKYRLSDGSFSHKAGASSNETATEQVFRAMTAYKRMQSGKGGYYILDNRNPGGLTKPGSATVSKTESAAKSSGSSSNAGSTVSKNKTADVNQDTSLTKTKSDTASAAATANEVTDGTDTPSAVQNTDNSKGGFWGSYKPLVCIIIFGAGCAVCLVLFLLKKRNYKNFIAVFALVLAAILFVVFTNFQTTADYYNTNQAEKKNAVGTVTLCIRCDEIVGKSDSQFIPKDGVILNKTEFEIEKDDTVYDILVEATRKNGIQMEKRGADNMVYISGINYLYELDFGDMSGWIYHVNDEEPLVGCGEYKLSDGDNIEWLYTCDLGKDLK